MKKSRAAKLYALALVVPVYIVGIFTGNIFAAIQQKYSVVKVIPSNTYYEMYGKPECVKPKQERFQF